MLKPEFVVLPAPPAIRFGADDDFLRARRLRSTGRWRTLNAFALAWLCLIGTPDRALAQTADRPVAPRQNAHAKDIAVWLALSGKSPRLRFLGDTPGQRLGLAAVRATWPLRGGSAYHLDYTVDFIPLALITRPIGYNNYRPVCPPAEPCLLPLVNRVFPEGQVYGFGASPLGASVTLRPKRTVQFLLGATLGALWFTRPVPVTTGSRFNFTASAGGGVAVLGERGQGIAFGYRFHHLSNARLGRSNPGLASHMAYVELRWRR